MDAAILNQQKAEILRQINYYTQQREKEMAEAFANQRRIADLTQQLQSLSKLLGDTQNNLDRCMKDIEEHEDVLLAVKGYENRFREGIEERMRRMEQVEANSDTAVFAKEYSQSMRAKLTGPSFYVVESGIEDGKKSVINKIQSLQDEEDNLRKQLRDAENQINNTKIEMNNTQIRLDNNNARARDYQNTIDQLHRQLRQLELQA